MTPISKALLVFAMSMAIAALNGQVLAKTSGAGQVKTSGKSAAQGVTPAGGSIVRRPKGCGHKAYGACAEPPAPGATSGGNPIDRGPGHPTLHPK